MIRLRIVLAAALIGVMTQTGFADVRSDQKTHVEFAGMLGRMVNFFGGKAAREGVTSMVAVKGNRKATLNDTTGQIIDLTEEKIYELDIKKKSYKVTTFAELRRRMEEAQKKAAEDAKKESPQQEAAPPPDPNQKQMEVDVDIKNTGQTRTINTFATRETVMTVTLREKGKTVEQGGGMILTTDMWLAPRIAAMKEITDFDIKYAEKLYGPMFTGVSAEQMAAAMAMYPMMKQAIARMNTEGAKLDGTAILTTMTIDAVKSQEQMAQEAKQSEPESQGKAPTGLGGLLGGFAKKAAAKKAGNEDAAGPRTTFMTSTTEVLKVATEVSAGDVAVPMGFKESR